MFGFNSNSPIVNNCGMGGYYQNNIPPQPIGNIVDIGNSGYITGNYSGRFYDPYQLRRQQEAIMIQQREAQRQQIDIFKKISKCVHASRGQEITDEDLEKIYNPQVQYNQVDQYEQTMEYLSSTPDYEYNPYANCIAEANKQYDEMEKIFPKDMTLTEFYEESYHIKLKILEDEQIEQQKNLTKMYDRQGYAQLLKMHERSSKMYNSIFRNPGMDSDSIDDLTVSAEGVFTEQERQKQIRKEQFLAALLSDNKMG